MRRTTKEDCGCIDGRRAEEVHFIDENGNEAINEIDCLSAHERYKVAGGGYITSLAMLAGIGALGAHIDEDTSRIVDDLREHGIFCGAHNGHHGHGEKSDCGANDNIRLILENGVIHKESIKNSITGLLGIIGFDVDDKMIDKIFEDWNSVAENDEYFNGSCGNSRFEKIKTSINNINRDYDETENHVAVSKKLAGDH